MTVVGIGPFGHFGPPIAYGEGMKRISSNIVGTSIFALALSTVVVGVAWAGSSALRNPEGTISASDTTMPTDDSVPNDGDNVVIEPGTPLDNSELTQLVASLTEQIDDLSDVVNQSVEELDAAVKRITAAETGLVDAQTDATSALSQAKKAVAAAEDASSKVDDVATTVEEVSSAVTQVKTKLVKISDDGTYTGTITHRSRPCRRMATRPNFGRLGFGQTESSYLWMLARFSLQHCCHFRLLVPYRLSTPAEVRLPQTGGPHGVS